MGHTLSFCGGRLFLAGVNLVVEIPCPSLLIALLPPAKLAKVDLLCNTVPATTQKVDEVAYDIPPVGNLER